MADVKVRVELNKNNFKDFDKYNGLKKVESLSQSSPDAGSIYYGTLENSGSVELVDEDGKIYEMLASGEMDNSNTKISVIVNGNVVQNHIGVDSVYSRNEKVLTIDLGNKVNILDVLKYKGYTYQNKEQKLSEMLFNVLYSLNYALFDKPFYLDEFKKVLSDTYDGEQTLYDYLDSTIIKYPFIESNQTYRQVLEQFCVIAQMQMFIDDNNQVRFTSARPKSFDEIKNAIHVPTKNMFSQLDYNVILKNKYDGVEISKTNVNDVIDYDTVVFSDTYDKSSLTIDSSEEKQGYNSTKFTTVNGNYDFRCVSFIDANYTYVKGSLNIPKSSEDNLSQILKVKDFNVENTEADEKTFSTYQIKYGVYTGDITSSVTWYKSSNKVSLNQDITIPNLTYKNDVTEQGYVKDYNESIIKVTDGSMTVDVPVKSETASLKPQITIEDKGSYYYVEYKLCFGKELSMLSGKQQYNDLYASEVNVNVSGTHYSYIPLELSLSIYGNKRTITFNQIQVSTENIESAKTKVSISSGSLMQKDKSVNEIKNNILQDYMAGISNGTATISCNDYYDAKGNKVIDWSKGELPKVQQIVYFDNDKYITGNQRYWRIKGRTFKKEGVPMLDLELEEISYKVLESYTWQQINEISQNGLAKSTFSVGDTKKIQLNTGEVVTATIIGFNHDTLSDNSGVAGITFAVTDYEHKAPFGRYTYGGEYWSESLVRQTTMLEIFNSLPGSLSGFVKTVKKVSDASDASNYEQKIETNDNVWLFSRKETFNYGDDGQEYKYMVNNLKELVSESQDDWWLRSVSYASQYHQQTFVKDYNWYTTPDSRQEKNIVFGFCI